jgi:transposase
MGFREVTMVEIKEVLRRWLGGTGRKKIARQLGPSRNTVRHYIEVAESCGLKVQDGVEALTDERLAEILTRLKATPEREHGDAWSSCEEQREFIRKKLEKDLRLSKIRKLLARRGVIVPYATLHRFAVAELDFGRGAPTIPVADGEPGQEVQLDTGWMTLLEPDEHGRRRRFRAWIFTAVCSRHRFVYPTFRETTVDAIEACEEAWAFFGGVFHVLIPDNTKAIVQRADPLDAMINAAFLEYSQARGFVIDAARAKHPKDKGRVERAVQPTRDDCFAGEQLRSIEDARRRARQWCLAEYGLRRHTRTRRLPLEHFAAEEQAKLLPAPTTPYEVPLWCDPKVHPDQHAQVAYAIYSLPRELRGRRLRARADRTTVRFYHKGLLVKTHPRQPPGGRSTDPADFPAEQLAYAQRDVAFLERQARTHGAAVAAVAQKILAGPLPWTRMRRVYALLGLCRRYGDARVEETCARALAADLLDVRRIERMLKLAAPPPTPAGGAPHVIPLCRYLRPPEQYTLPFGRTDKEPKKGDG